MTRKIVSSVSPVMGLALLSFLAFSFISLVQFTEMLVNLSMTLTTL